MGTGVPAAAAAAAAAAAVMAAEARGCAFPSGAPLHSVTYRYLPFQQHSIGRTCAFLIDRKLSSAPSPVVNVPRLLTNPASEVVVVTSGAIVTSRSESVVDPRDKWSITAPNAAFEEGVSGAARSVRGEASEYSGEVQRGVVRVVSVTVETVGVTVKTVGVAVETVDVTVETVGVTV